MNRMILTVAGVFTLSSLLLVDSAVKGTALLVLAAIAAMILRRDSAATRHLVWLLAIVAMLVVPVLSAMLPQWRVLPEWAGISSKPVVVATSPPSIARPAEGAVELPQNAEPVEIERPPVTAYQPAAELPDSRPALVTPKIIPASAVWSWNWSNALPFVWAIGFSVLILRLMAARLMLWNSELRGTVIGSTSQPAKGRPAKATHDPLVHDPLVTGLEAVCLQLGIGRPVTLLIHPDNSIPVVWGILRCRLLLPAAARHWSGEQLRSVLLHELAHIKRRDTMAQLLTQIACTLHWFNPLVWFAAWRLGVERERACDDLVLASGVRPSAYARHLLEVVTACSPARWTQSCGLAMARQSSLEVRLVAVLSENLNRRGVSVTLAAIALAIGVGIAVPIAMLRAADGKKGDSTADTSGVESGTVPLGAIRFASDPDDPKFAGHFSGRVMGPDGKPLSGARVFIVPVHSASKEVGPVRTKTDADGRFEFDAPDMTYTEFDGLPARREGILIVTADGYAPDWFNTWGRGSGHSHLDPVKGTDLALQLAKDDVPIHGRFLDPAGRPLAGARVRLTALMIPQQRDLDAHLDRESKFSDVNMTDYERSLYRPDLVPALIAETRTDSDGRFTMSGLGRDRIADVTVSAPSVVDTYLTVMTRDAPDVRTRHDFKGKTTQVIYGAGFTIKLEPGRTIKGRVIDRETREPIHGMWVGPQQNALNGFSLSVYPRVTDEQGRFTITGLNSSIDKQVVVAVAAPGLPYQTAVVEVEGDSEALINCMRGIPFHLKLIDEQGRPVEAEVTYVDVQPNPNIVHDEAHWPVSRAARKADGTYDGYVLPGPGAVLVDTGRGSGYRPARVEPKAFFAPGRTHWTPEEQVSAYGTLDTLTTCQGRYRGTIYRGSSIDQHAYAAIVLVNPPANSGSLELSATVVPDGPRQVSLIGAEKQDSPASTPPVMKPKHESAQSLFKKWQDSARTDGKIPGGALGSLAAAVANFIKLNPTDERVPKVSELLQRIDTSHDWAQADAVALLNDLTDIYPTRPEWAGAYGFSIGGPIRPGEPLPAELSGAAWGQPAANGLLAAWLLEPVAQQYPLGTNLKARILFHNTGKETVVFRTPDWHQYSNHQARDVNGTAIEVSATYWTRLSTLVAIRLAPGEYAEVEAHGIAIGPKNKVEENWAGLRVGAWIEAKEGDEVTFQPATVGASEDAWTPPAERRTPLRMWFAIVRERIDREGPMPAAAADREQLIRRVTLDLVGVPPTPEKIAAFTADNSPNALTALAYRLVPRVVPFAGDLPAGEINFRVTAADPDAAKKPRVATGSGWYTIGDHVRLSIVQKPDGDRRVNEANIMFFSPDPKVEPPGKPHEIKLPDGVLTWAIGWERGSTVLWVVQMGLVRKYDFTIPAQVKETRFEPGSIVDVPEQLRDSLRKVFDVPGAPVQQPESQKPKDGAKLQPRRRPKPRPSGSAGWLTAS